MRPLWFVIIKPGQADKPDLTAGLLVRSQKIGHAVCLFFNYVKRLGGHVPPVSRGRAFFFYAASLISAVTMTMRERDDGLR